MNEPKSDGGVGGRGRRLIDTYPTGFNGSVTCVGCVRHDYYESGKNACYPLCDNCIRHGRLRDNFSTTLPDGTRPDITTHKKIADQIYCTQCCHQISMLLLKDILDNPTLPHHCPDCQAPLHVAKGQVKDVKEVLAWNSPGTTTGRIQCKKPNKSNTPKEVENGS
jgi:hypothetical protein